MRIYLGADRREKLAYDVAIRSLRKHCDIEPTPLEWDRLHASGLLRRLMDRRGQMWDMHSNAPCSTEFAIARFLVPMLAQTGWALFCDSDVVFLDNPEKMLHEADSRYAVQVVKHKNGHHEGIKMDGQLQTMYDRKNWSSVMLFNCDHPANRRLSIQDVNERPGLYLHTFGWLADSEIGSLAPEWNVLVGIHELTPATRIAHYTLGTPDMVPDSPHADLWWNAGKGFAEAA